MSRVLLGYCPRRSCLNRPMLCMMMNRYLILFVLLYSYGPTMPSPGLEMAFFREVHLAQQASVRKQASEIQPCSQLAFALPTPTKLLAEVLLPRLRNELTTSKLIIITMKTTVPTICILLLDTFDLQLLSLIIIIPRFSSPSEKVLHLLHCARASTVVPILLISISKFARLFSQY